MTAQAKPPSTRIPLLLSGAVVFVSLVLGAAFVWWYLNGPGQTRIITLSPADVATLQNTGRQLTYQGNGGIPLNGNRRVVRSAVLRTAADPDGVFPAGFSQSIRAGQVMVIVRVQLLGGPDAKPILVFRQRNWGMLQETTVFTIARRAVHEDALAQQLALTPAQLTQLKAIVATPALQQAYVASLPISAADEDRAVKAWMDYQKAIAGNDRPQITKATSDLLQTVRSIGNPAMAQARHDYLTADKAINDLLTPRQIEAYRTGKSLAAHN